MKTAVIYARYSSDKQTEQSIEGQLYDCYNYAKANNITVIGEYIDRAMTGRNDDRPDFQRMIADSAKHTFELVLVWKLDRFARSTEDAAYNRGKLKRNGVRLLSIKEDFGDSSAGDLMMHVMESFNEFTVPTFGKRPSEECTRAHLNVRAQAGKFLSAIR